MENESQYEKLKSLQDQEELTLDDLAFMIGLPKELIKEHLMSDVDKLSIKDLQERTRALVNDVFTSKSEESN